MSETDTWAMNPFFKAWGGPNVMGRHMITINVFRGPDLPLMQDGTLRLELGEDVTGDEVEKLVNLLNSQVERLTYTGPIKPEFVDQPGRGAVARRKKSR